MRVTIRLFAQQRQLAGWREKAFALPEDATAERAWEELAAELPQLAPARPFVRFARNAAYVDALEPLSDGDELAIIPPVAGGGDARSQAPRLRRIELRAEPFDDVLLAELRATVPTHVDGALVLFVGQTRESPGTAAPGQEAEAERFAGESVEGLEYEAFEQMALAVLDDICAEIDARFGVGRLAILHRTGTVGLGEASVVIAAAAAHRGAAFDACRYAIEELKARAPIWKSERFSSGAVWIGAPARHGPAGAHDAQQQPDAADSPDAAPAPGANPAGDGAARASGATAAHEDTAPRQDT